MQIVKNNFCNFLLRLRTRYFNEVQNLSCSSTLIFLFRAIFHKKKRVFPLQPCHVTPVTSISGSNPDLSTLSKSMSNIALTLKPTTKADSMAFVPVRISRPQLLPPVLCSRRFYVYLLLLVLIILILCVVRLVSQIKVTFVHMHLESDGDLERVTLPRSFSEPRGARCLDGSPPAYYFRPSKSVCMFQPIQIYYMLYFYCKN